MQYPRESSLFESEEEELQGQIQTWNLTFAFASSMALKAACLLGIPDILAREGPAAPLSLQEIASRLPHSSVPPRTDYLFRILRFLCAKGVLSLTYPPGSSEPKYGLTPVSKWLLQENKGGALSLTAMILMETSKEAQAPWHHFSECVLEDGDAFDKAHGMDLWSFGEKNPAFNQLFNAAMACGTNIVLKSVLKNYKGFANVETMVDVGGGIGTAAARVVAQYPHIKAINYDLPHVVATAPNYPGVQHVGGDMFKSVPPAGAIFMKWILHDWDDEACIKILKNCHSALSRGKGKLIIVEAILGCEGHPFREAREVFDLVMIAHAPGGRERTRQQWEALLGAAGFPRVNVIDLPCVTSLIEAFPS